MICLENFSVLLFDLDGTLVQGSDAHYEKCVAKTMKEILNIDFLPPRGASFRWILKSQFPDISDGIREKIYKRYCEYFHLLPRSVEFFADAEKFLDKTQHFKRALVTNCTAMEIDMTRKFLPIDSIFSEIVFRAPHMEPKPSGQMYEKAAENLMVSVSDCLVFEDSEMGIWAGKNAKMTVVAIDRHLDLNRKIIPADFWIKSFDEIV